LKIFPFLYILQGNDQQQYEHNFPFMSNTNSTHSQVYDSSVTTFPNSDEWLAGSINDTSSQDDSPTNPSKFIVLDPIEPSSSNSIYPVSTSINPDPIISPNSDPITVEPEVGRSLETSPLSQEMDDMPLVDNASSPHPTPTPTITTTKPTRDKRPPPHNLMMPLLFQMMSPKAIKLLLNTQIGKQP
jgi:hypothetical protein